MLMVGVFILFYIIIIHHIDFFLNFSLIILFYFISAPWRREVKIYNDCVRGHNEYFIPSDLTTMIMKHARAVFLAAPLGGVTVLNPLNGIF